MDKHHQKHSVLAKQDVVVLNITTNEREVKLEKSSVDKRADWQKKRPGLADLLKSIRIEVDGDKYVYDYQLFLQPMWKSYT